MRHQLDVHGDTVADLEAAVAHLKAAGAPATATIAVRTRVSFSAEGGGPRTVTARWDPQGTGER